MLIVSDTSPLINLAAIGQLNLIPQLFGSVILPQAVFDEITIRSFNSSQSTYNPPVGAVSRLPSHYKTHL